AHPAPARATGARSSGARQAARTDGAARACDLGRAPPRPRDPDGQARRAIAPSGARPRLLDRHPRRRACGARRGRGRARRSARGAACARAPVLCGKVPRRKVMTEHTVLLLEPNRAALNRAQDLIESLGHTAIGVNAVDTALHLVTTQQPSVVLASHPTQERVIARLRQSGLVHTSLLVSLPAKVSQPQDIAEGLGADAFVVRPYRRETLASALHAALAIRHVRAHLVELAADLERERARLQRMGDVDPQTSFYHFE